MLVLNADLDVPIGLTEDLRDPAPFAELPPATSPVLPLTTL